MSAQYTHSSGSAQLNAVLPVNKLFKQDAVGKALSPDVHCLQDPGVAQLHDHPLLAEAQRLSVIVGPDAANKVGLTHHHLGEQIHQGVLRTDREDNERQRGWGKKKTRIIICILFQCHRGIP